MTPVTEVLARPRESWWRDDASEPVRRNLGLVGRPGHRMQVGMSARQHLLASRARLARIEQRLGPRLAQERLG